MELDSSSIKLHGMVRVCGMDHCTDWLVGSPALRSVLSIDRCIIDGLNVLLTVVERL